MKPLPATFALYRSADDRLLIVATDDWSAAAGRVFDRREIHAVDLAPPAMRSKPTTAPVDRQKLRRYVPRIPA